MRSVFFSYSHKDEELRDELEVHLSVLKRQGVISTWHDRRIQAGSEIDGEISEYLESADVVLLLVSPHFLASSYINDIELKRALERHEEGTAVVVPVILHPCDWKHAPFGKLLACPKDGKPVSKHPNIHEAFLDITTSIRGITEELPEESHSENQALQPGHFPTAAHSDRSSNLRIKREFTDHERDQFLDETFLYIASFFENSLSELKSRNSGAESRFVSRDNGRFACAVYINGKKIASCSVWVGNELGWSRGVCFSHGDSTYSRGINESITVDSDGYSLGLKTMGLALRGPSTDTLLTQQGAAEHLWAMLVEQLQ